jgi:hypothetical protein
MSRSASIKTMSEALLDPEPPIRTNHVKARLQHQMMDSLSSLLPPVQIHSGFCTRCFISASASGKGARATATETG